MTTNKPPTNWLKEGKQSQITNEVKKISHQIDGEGFGKIIQIFQWIENNLKHCEDDKKVKEIFATRTASKVIEDKFSTGCHDQALVFATLVRSIGIPAKYVVGIDKLNPRDKGHCIVEIFINERWVLVDQSRWLVSLIPSRSSFYEENYIIGKGLDSWDLGIKSFASWNKKALKLIKTINKIKV